MDGRGFVVACSLADRTSPRRCIEESCLGSVEVGPATFANREADASLCLLLQSSTEKEGGRAGDEGQDRADEEDSCCARDCYAYEQRRPATTMKRRYSREREGTD